MERKLIFLKTENGQFNGIHGCFSDVYKYQLTCWIGKGPFGFYMLADTFLANLVRIWHTLKS